MRKNVLAQDCQQRRSCLGLAAAAHHLHRMRAARHPFCRPAVLLSTVLVLGLAALANGQIFGPTDGTPAGPSSAPAAPPSAAVGDVWWTQATGWFCSPVAVNASGNVLPVRLLPRLPAS